MQEEKPKRKYTKKPVDRPKEFKGFDFFADQLEAIKDRAVKLNRSQVDILREILDNSLKTPKDGAKTRS